MKPVTRRNALIGIGGLAATAVIGEATNILLGISGRKRRVIQDEFSQILFRIRPDFQSSNTKALEIVTNMLVAQRLLEIERNRLLKRPARRDDSASISN